MKTMRAIATALLSLCLSAAAFGQSSNARVSGTVNDASGAVLPGVEITATNNATGVVTTVLSNEAGAYNFASLLPGTYTVSASLPAFRTQTFREVLLGNAAQVRLNFTLQVGAVATAIEVNVAADQILLESSSSVGEVLEQREVVNLPLVSNNVLDLVQVMAGVKMTNNPIFGAGETQFAGVSATNINVQRDGIPVTGSRWPTGLETTTEMNPDLVGEVKMVLAPVDAEMGRGSGQVQIRTRSGTNEFHGGVVWNARNTALDSNTWENNRSAVVKPWRNYPEATASLGGPIVRNKTHFFALYDQAWARTRTAYNASVLTPCAQRGIFRYYDNWNSANGTNFTAPTWAQPPLAAGATPTIPVINAAGVPVAPATNPNGTPHNGILRYASIYGPLLRAPTQADCSDAQVQTGRPWDPFRTQKDTTGYVDTLFKFMPAVNNYDIGDGLNTAGHRWTRGLNGADNLFGIGEPVQKKQYNGKIDHIFNQSHKISGSYSYERTSASDTFRTWPGTYEGEVLTAPQVLTVNFTSTLSPTLVNEGRFGMSRMGTNVYATLYNPKVRDEILKLLPTSGNTTYLPLLGAAQVNFQVDQIVGTRGFTPQPILRDNTPRFVYADTLSVTVGKHAFRFGGEYRHGSSKSIVSSVGPANFPECGQFNGFNGDPTTPIAYGGAAPGAPVTGITGANIPGLAGNPGAGNQQRMENLLMFLSGSLCGVAQFRYINRPDQAGKEWNDPAKDPFKIRDFHQNEFGSFFKDDWKVSKSVTLNLGLRWDYYGPPYEKNGLSATLKGGGAGLFGMSGRDFGGWMAPGKRADDSELIFIGPNSPNPSISPYPKDRNNFGPAVGFAWNATPRTTIRGGYQLQYIGGGFGGVEDRLGNPPGSIFSARYTGDSNTPHLDMTSLARGRIPLPIAPPVLPVQPIPVTNRQTGIQAYDVNFVNPYIQNLTLSVTRNLRSNLTFDARYIGTLTRKNFNSINLNEPNFLTNGLFEAFEAARSGGESALLNQMFNGINIAGAGFGPVNGPPVNGIAQTGALHLRSALAGNLRGNLAMGNYSALATSLSTLNYFNFNPGNASLPAVPFGVNGAVLRHNGFPENFITTSPQFSAATYQTNGAHSNYHSLQLQSTLRPTYGLTVQGSYTWSKNLGVGTGGFTDPRNQAPDYTLLTSHRTHVVQSYGTFDLPVGPGQRLAANTSGILARVIEGWQTSWIVNLSSGLPISMTAANMLYGRGTPDQVRPFDFNEAGRVQWPDGARAGNYFGNQFTKVTDPQCRAIAASLQPFCTLLAVTDTSGNIILQNPRPGTRGNVGLQTIEGAGVWTADMAFAKIFRINERFRGQIRMDAKNVFNHPTPGAPGAGFGAAPNDGGAQLNLNDTNPFGNIPLKGASVPQFPAARQFQLKVRLDF